MESTEPWINASLLPVQTRSHVAVHAADWKNPDEHAPEQPTVTLHRTNYADR